MEEEKYVCLSAYEVGFLNAVVQRAGIYDGALILPTSPSFGVPILSVLPLLICSILVEENLLFGRQYSPSDGVVDEETLNPSCLHPGNVSGANHERAFSVGQTAPFCDGRGLGVGANPANSKTRGFGILRRYERV